MPSVRMPGPLPDFELVQTEQWFDADKLKTPGKQELSLRTHATVQLALSCIDAADKLLGDLADPQGPHALYVSREVKYSVSKLKERSDELLVALIKRFDTTSIDAVSRLTLLLVQAGFVLTQLHDQSLAEEWLTVGNEQASKLLLARYGGQSRADRVTTYREALAGMLTLPESALDQPFQIWDEDGQQFRRLASIDILAEEHVHVPRDQAGQLPGGYVPASEAPPSLVFSRGERLAAGAVFFRTKPVGQPLHRGELLPDVAPEHAEQHAHELEMAARAQVLHTVAQDPRYMPTALPQLEKALRDVPGLPKVKPLFGTQLAPDLRYLTQPEDLAVPDSQVAALRASMEKFMQEGQTIPFAHQGPMAEVKLGVDLGAPDGDKTAWHVHMPGGDVVPLPHGPAGIQSIEQADELLDAVQEPGNLLLLVFYQDLNGEEGITTRLPAGYTYPKVAIRVRYQDAQGEEVVDVIESEDGHPPLFQRTYPTGVPLHLTVQAKGYLLERRKLTLVEGAPRETVHFGLTPKKAPFNKRLKASV